MNFNEIKAKFVDALRSQGYEYTIYEMISGRQFLLSYVEFPGNLISLILYYNRDESTINLIQI